MICVVLFNRAVAVGGMLLLRCFDLHGLAARWTYWCDTGLVEFSGCFVVSRSELCKKTKFYVA